jgi:hypothetical protein
MKQEHGATAGSKRFECFWLTDGNRLLGGDRPLITVGDQVASIVRCIDKTRR